MFCSNCGKSLDNNSAFCPECGTKVNINIDTSFEKPVLSDDASQKTVYVPENQDESEVMNVNSGEITEEEELTETPPPVENDFGNTVSTENEQKDAPEIVQNDAPEIEQKNVPGNEAEKPVSQSDIMRNGDKYNTISIPIGNSMNEQNAVGNENQQQNNAYQETVRNFQFNPSGEIPQTAYAPPPDYNYDPLTPQKSSKVGAGRIVGASAVAFFAVIFLIILSSLLCFKFGASGKILKDRIESLSATTLLGAEFEDDEMSNNIYKTIGFRSITHGNATEADFKEYLSKSSMLSFIGENVESYADYILNGNGKDPSITARDIKTDFFKANNDVADEIFGYTLSKDDLKLIQSRLEEENIDEALSIREWNKKAGFNVKNASYILSYITLGIFLALIIVLCIWIAIIVDKKGRHIMSFYGNILFIPGIILLISGLGVLVGSAIAYSITGNVIFYLIQNVLLLFGILSSAVGAFELILGIIFKKIGKRKKKKEKAAAQIQREAVPAYN
jgi:hypothetical protein rflaF_05359